MRSQRRRNRGDSFAADDIDHRDRRAAEVSDVGASAIRAKRDMHWRRPHRHRANHLG